MKKRVVVFFVIAITFTLSGCSVIQTLKGNFVEPISEDPKNLTNVMGQDIMSALRGGDKAKFLSLFSIKAKEQDNKIEKKVNKVFEFIQQKIKYSKNPSEWYKKENDSIAKTKPEENWYYYDKYYGLGHKPRYVCGINEVIINDEIYTIYFIYLYHYKYLDKEKKIGDDSDWIGLLSCAIYKTEDRLVPSESDYDEQEEMLDLVFEPGFYFYPANEVSQ